MGNKNKVQPKSLVSQALTQLGAYSGLVLLERGVGFALLPIYTRALTPAMYGTMELLDLTTNVAGMLMACRITEALAYSYHGEENTEKRKRYVSTAVIASLFLGIAMTVVMLLGANELSLLVFGTPGQTRAFRLLALTLGLSFPLESAVAAFRTAGIVWAFTATGIARLLLTATLMLTLVVHFQLGVMGWLWSGLIANIVLGAAAITYAVWRWGVSVDIQAAWRMFRYSLPLNLSAIAMFVINFGDRWFLRRSGSLDALGVYSLAYKIGMLVAYVQVPFSLFWSSQMFAISGGANGERRHVAVATYTALAYGCATVFLANAAYPLVYVWVGPAYRHAAVFVPVIAIAYMLRAEGEFFRSAFEISGRTSFHAWITGIGAAVCLVCYVFLIPRFTSWGAVITTLATFLLMFIVSIWKAQEVAPYPFQWRRLQTIWALTVGCATVPLWHSPSTLSEAVVTSGIAMGAFVIGLIVFGVLDANQLWMRIRSAGQGHTVLRTPATTEEY